MSVLHELRAASDFYIRLIVTIVALVTLVGWSKVYPDFSLVYSLFALVMVIAIVILGVTNTIKKDENLERQRRK